MQNTNNKPRVRIAPSPTGNLHVGTARTALFNWLYAKSTGGTFVLRIEDTDLERSDPKFETNIIEGLKWLGLTWDEGPEVGGPYGPYRQSERIETYEKYINELLAKGLAYYCTCEKDELEAERTGMLSQGIAPKYSGKCRDKKHPTGEVIRFIIPESKISFNDLIRGSIEFDGALLGDIAIAKNPRTPLYNFAVVIDDYEMKITDVIRGEDHIANTPKQLFIQKALGFEPPNYAHLPLILDEDRAKMSKRFSATSIDEYKQDGYLPKAIINFLSLLGWHPEDDKELMNADEIIGKFTLERVQKAGAVFNVQKLRWINSHYIKTENNSEIWRLISSIYPELSQKLQKFDIKMIESAIELSKNRMETLKDFEKESSFIFELQPYDPKLLIWKDADQKIIKENLEMIFNAIESVAADNFSKNNLDEIIKKIAEDRGRGEVFWPLRVALSGLDKSPGPVEIAEVLGKNETIKRVKMAIEKLG